MEETSEIRFDGVIDHIAVESQDLKGDVHAYKQLGLRVESLYQDWAMIRRSQGEGRLIKEHRDRSVSFYTKGAGGRAVEVIFYPSDYKGDNG